MLKTTPRLASTWHTSRSAEDSSSRVLAFLRINSPTQYKGNPSKAVRSCSEQHTLKNFPLKPLYNDWNNVRMTLPATPLKLTQRFFPGFLASKKWRKTSTEGGWPKWLQRMEKALTKAQLLGCSWVGATLTSVSSSLSKLVKGRCCLMRLKTV